MPVRFIQRKDLSKYTLKSFDGTDEICCDTNASDQFSYNANGTQLVLADTSTAQTLTNKTLTSPTLTSSTLSSPTITGVPNINVLKSAFNTIDNAGTFATDTYLAGSSIAIPAGGFVAGARYYGVFDMVKTAAGTAQFTIIVRIGTAASTSDAAILTFAFAAGTAAGDTGLFEVMAHFRTVGSGTAAVLEGIAYCSHHLAATGLVSTGASGYGQLQVTSSGFDSTIANTFIGMSVNGGASFAGTNKHADAELRSF